MKQFQACCNYFKNTINIICSKHYSIVNTIVDGSSKHDGVVLPLDNASVVIENRNSVEIEVVDCGC